MKMSAVCMSKCNSSGFTLIEVMVVVVILGILAAMIVPKVMNRPDDARIMQARQNIRALSTALDMYKMDNQTYPTTDQGLESLSNKPNIPPEPINWRGGGYIDQLPADPWGNTYLYLHPGLHGEVDVFSYGADGRAGGEGINVDIGNWSLREPLTRN